jgi:hypothetical protein
MPGWVERLVRAGSSADAFCQLIEAVISVGFVWLSQAKPKPHGSAEGAAANRSTAANAR